MSGAGGGAKVSRVSLAERRLLRLFTLCALYVAQGIPWGFMATTLPAYLSKQGLDLAFVSATLSLSYLPYSFKWVWGPVIDTFTIARFGRRRPWIVFAQAMMAVTVLAIVALDVTREVKLLAWMILIHTVFNALQDVAVDALAVDLLSDDERGRANGFMYASKYLGGAIGGVGMATVTVYAGLDTALVIQTAILLAIMLLPLLLRERANGPRPERPPFGEILAALGQAFSLRSTLLTALLVLGMNIGVGLTSATAIELYIKQLGWNYDEYAAISGGWGLAVGCACAAAGGWLADRFGRRRIIATAAIAMAASWVAFALLRDYWHDRSLVYALALTSAACLAVTSVATIALAMDVSWPAVAGSQFTAYMALSNFSTTLGFMAAPHFNEIWTFHGVYLIAAAIQVGVTLLVLAIDPTETRRVLPLPPGTPVDRRGIAALLGLLVFLIVMTGYVTFDKLG